ncbi:DNA polymerase zeta, partial [Kappamyces sp. JEL0680]
PYEPCLDFSSSGRNAENLSWNNESEQRSKLHERIQFLLGQSADGTPLPGLLHSGPLPGIPTVFQAVALLHPPKRRAEDETGEFELSPSPVEDEIQASQWERELQLLDDEASQNDVKTQIDWDVVGKIASSHAEDVCANEQDIIDILAGMGSDRDSPAPYHSDHDDDQEASHEDFIDAFFATQAVTANDLDLQLDTVYEKGTSVASLFSPQASRSQHQELPSDSSATSSGVSQLLDDGLDAHFLAVLDNLEKDIDTATCVIPQVDGAADAPRPPKRKSRSSRSLAFKRAKKVRFQQDVADEPIQHDIPNWPLYFAASITNTWSPEPIRQPEKWAFFHDPPRPVSPGCDSEAGPESMSPVPGPSLPMGQKVLKSPGDSDSLEKNLLVELSSEPSSIHPSHGSEAADWKLIGSQAAPSDTPGPLYRRAGRRVYTLAQAPPSVKELIRTLDDFHIPHVIYPEPFYSNPKDVPAKPMVYAGKVFDPKCSTDLSKVPTFRVDDAVRGYWQTQPSQPESRGRLCWGIEYYKSRVGMHGNESIANQSRFYTLAKSPPSVSDVRQWLSQPHDSATPRVSPLEQPSLRNKYNFQFSQTQPAAILDGSRSFLHLLSLEIHVAKTGPKLPHPERDPVAAVFYCSQSGHSIEHKDGLRTTGIVAVKDGCALDASGLGGYHLRLVQDEHALLRAVASIVRTFDPDILAGWEIQDASWGYLVARAKKYEFDLLASLSRIIPKYTRSHGSREQDEWGFKKQSSLHTAGRIFLNIWRIMRKELTLVSYSLENVVFHVLHQRIPKYTYDQLANWYGKGMLVRWKTLKYYLERARYNLDLLVHTEWISQTSEFAKVYAIPFYSVVIRGSQFKVEAVMARIARPENFILYTPSRKMVAAMDPPLCIPLNMEPDSQLYTSPLLVLDFQSLYPSLMIAYNYCFSTVLGRVATVGDRGLAQVDQLYEISPQVLAELEDHVNVAPNGVVFVKPHVRQGVLGRMVREILETRIMVKQSMKLYQSSKALSRVLQAKQLGLKLLANVTFGYTAAAFSGTMPCTLISDAIIQSGRATLERSKEWLETANPAWRARVVYADTDSLFVHLPGKTKAEAFAVGADMVAAITRMNPAPVKLQFEKVYHPCILLAKKRYVGFKFAASTDTEPVFDAKGIETVRRDGCPAVAKCMETSLKILFRTKDLSLVKEYLYRQWSRIIANQASVQDFIISKEVKLGTYRNAKSLPPGAHLSVKKMQQDERAEPEYGDRVPYVVVYCNPKGRLKDSVVSPETLANDPSLQLHATYYITKQIIPALARVFNLVGADLTLWYHQMPKISRAILYQEDASNAVSRRTIDHYYKSSLCLVCDERIAVPGPIRGICSTCIQQPLTSLGSLTYTLKHRQERYKTVQDVCRSCSGLSTLLDRDIPCVSLDCGVYFSRMKASKTLATSQMISQAIADLGDSLAW